MPSHHPLLGCVHPLLLHYNTHKLTEKAVGTAQLPGKPDGDLRLPDARVTAIKTLLGHVPT